ncbi:MAG TPA: MFS transporter [Acidimicrobiales bacterium]
MSAADLAAGSEDAVAPPAARGIRRLWDRELRHYPATRARYRLLALVVLSSIVMYYQQYVAGSVSSTILAYYQMSFRFYLTIVVVSSVAGAMSSLIASTADRIGRANMVVVGLFAVGVVTLFGIPNAHTKASYALAVCVVGFFEGMVLVATPALVRDFSPQQRRGAAMGFWTLGPVLGSLTVSLVASQTADSHAWQFQFKVAGTVGLVVFVLALLFLRELAPSLRDQLMTSIRERVLAEVRARGLQVENALKHPFRQMIGWNTVLPSLGVGFFLLIYLSAVGFFVIYFVSVFGFSQSEANGLGNWFWSADAVAVVAVGVISDKLQVRKPFMLLGGAVAVGMGLVFASLATRPHTSYSTFVVVIMVMSAARGVAYAPWMAAYTETLESRNPALVATGLAIWGWTLRLVAATAFLVVPFIVPSATPVADFGTHARALQVEYAPQIATLKVIQPATLAKLQVNPADRKAQVAAIAQIHAATGQPFGEAAANLIAASKIPKADRAFLAAHGREVLAARAAAPKEWQRWWLICVAGEVLFIPTIFLLVGRWRRSSAVRDREEYEQRVNEEFEELSSSDQYIEGVPA